MISEDNLELFKISKVFEINIKKLPKIIPIKNDVKIASHNWISKKNSNGQNFILIYCVFEAVKIPKIINVGITNKADIAFFNVFINIIFVYLFDLLILFPF